jgi:hypothetical protein
MTLFDWLAIGGGLLSGLFIFLVGRSFGFAAGLRHQHEIRRTARRVYRDPDLEARLRVEFGEGDPTEVAG